MSNYIFDVDGTLLDSYGGILESVMEILNKNNYKMDENEALRYILKYSVHDLLIKIEKEDGIPFNKTILEYKESRKRTIDNYTLIPNCLNMLNKLKESGANLFIFTHKGEGINHIVEKNFKGIFKEVIYSVGANFKRKPSGDSINYLVAKYGLNKNSTYYVGDRPIDIECAYNSNIKSIFYNNNNMDLIYNPTFRIKDLNEIIDIEKSNNMYLK